MFASHHKLDNLVAIVDRNRLQSIQSTEDTIALEPFADKWRAFGWRVVEVDAHNHSQMLETLKDKASSPRSRPLVMIANSTKGKGISFMENSVLWHYRCPQGDELKSAMRELNKGVER